MWLDGVRRGEVGGGGGGGLNTCVRRRYDAAGIQTDGAPSWPGDFRAALFLNSPKKTKKIQKKIKQKKNLSC